MSKKRSLTAIIIVLALCVCMTLALSGCIVTNVPTVNSDGNKTSSTSTTTTTAPTTRNNYTVEVNTATSTAEPTSLVETVSNIQKSVVIISAVTESGTSLGSGVLYGRVKDSSTGEYVDATMVITCCHVVDGASEIKVTLNDGDTDETNDVTLSATLIGMDDESDIAILQIDGDYSEYSATIRDTSASPIRLAETVIAIGNPLGQGISVTTGIISGVSKTINMDGVNMSLLQTDAAINKGNSGGALFDESGLLIGIVNAKSSGDTVEGIGYAIHIEDAVSVGNSIITTSGNDQYNGLGYVEGKIRLGVVVSALTKENVQSTFSNIPTLPGDNEYFYYISPNYDINAYGSVALSENASKVAQGMLITAVTYTKDGTQTTVKFTSTSTLQDTLKTLSVGDVITLQLITPSTRGFMGSQGYTYTTSSVDITLRQYVYGYKG